MARKVLSLAKEPEDCGSCRFWAPPRPMPTRAGGLTTHGRCRRFPEEQPKDAHDYCGEFKRAA